MLSDSMLRNALLISIAGHCLLLGTPGFHIPAQQQKNPDELKVEIETPRPSLLPKIDTIDKIQKFKNLKEELRSPKSPPRFEKTAFPEETKEKIQPEVKATESQDEVMLRYQDMVKRMIEEARRYPLWAKKHGIEGVARIYFTVLPDGKGEDVKITHSSGSSILDNEASDTVIRAGPFPPLPRELENSPIGMEVAIVFSLNSAPSN
ncbi:MAG: energy transducer TonB [Candidatus Omnitrophota bacterium]